MAYEFKEYPKFLYHPTLAPKGKVFQSAEETKGLARQGWVDTPVKFPRPVRPGARGIVDRYRRLTVWNKLGFWGSLASLVSLALYFFPGSVTVQQSANVQGSGATIIQPGRDAIINPPANAAAPRRILLPQQQRLLELVAHYQRQFAANRLIVSRSDGTLHFR